ncbi:MAG: leucine-rich repeat domain-containing protein [Ignavibacteria bacterium]|nr:leucine-rich repeat domain-containing protein [Ignavibacteria bacterium]
MSMKTFCLALLAIILFHINVFGQEFNVDGINYKVTSMNPATVEVALNSSFKGNANIPDSVTNASTMYKVTSIGERAFTGCYHLYSASIPNSVISIGTRAFERCSRLTSVNISNTITSLRESTFDGCSSLTSINIPNSVITIGRFVFYACTSLTSVNIGNGVKSIGNFAFSDCTGLTSVNIPNSVTSIGMRAFQFCKGLQSVILSDSITSIGESSFVGCSNLTSINIPNSVMSIGESAFKDCYRLSSVYIPNSVNSISPIAFSRCTELTSVNIPKSVTTIGSLSFAFCSGLKSVTVHWNTPLEINANVFENVNVMNVTLYVPDGTQDAYRIAPGWKDFEIAVISGVHDFDVQDNLVQVFPNPVSHSFTVSSRDNPEGNFSYTIIDVEGRIVSQGNSSYIKPISTENLATGNYIINIITEQGKQLSQTLIKN